MGAFTVNTFLRDTPEGIFQRVSSVVTTEDVDADRDYLEKCLAAHRGMENSNGSKKLSKIMLQSGNLILFTLAT
jgi:hypothetical protein